MPAVTESGATIARPGRGDGEAAGNLPIVTRSIKLIRIRLAPLTAPEGPETPGNSRVSERVLPFLAGLRWGRGGCIVFQVAARETAKSW